MMNLLICCVLLGIVMFGIGLATPSNRILSVQTEIATEAGPVAGPAAQAGLQPGDRIVELNGEAISTWDEVRAAIATVPDAEIPIVVEREGASLTLQLSPVRAEEGKNLIGITADREQVRSTIPQYGDVLWATLSGTVKVVLRLPVAVWDVGRSLITGEERDPSGVISVVGVGRIAGDMTTERDGETHISFAQRMAGLLTLIASLNMALFVFNLIPLTPLDGGHVAWAIYEGGRRWLAKLRGKPDPGPADTARLMPLTYAVIAILIAMTILLVVADIVVPVNVL